MFRIQSARRALAPALLLAAGLLQACLPSAQKQPDFGAFNSLPLPGKVVDVAAGEFYFQAPDTIPAGLTTFRLRQMGLIRRRVLAGGVAQDSGAAEHGDGTRGFHMLWVVRLDSGRTAADLYRAEQAGEAGTEGRILGGPGFAPPPRTTNATLTLAPGNYVLVCFVGSDNAATRMPYEILGGLSDVPPGGSMLTTMTFEAGDHFTGNRIPFTVLPEPR